MSGGSLDNGIKRSSLHKIKGWMKMSGGSLDKGLGGNLHEYAYCWELLHISSGCQ